MQPGTNRHVHAHTQTFTHTHTKKFISRHKRGGYVFYIMYTHLEVYRIISVAVCLFYLESKLYLSMNMYLYMCILIKLYK